MLTRTIDVRHSPDKVEGRAYAEATEATTQSLYIADFLDILDDRSVKSDAGKSWPLPTSFAEFAHDPNESYKEFGLISDAARIGSTIYKWHWGQK